MLLITALDLHTIFNTPSSAATGSSAIPSGDVGVDMNVAIDSSMVPGRAVELGAICGSRSWLRTLGSVPCAPQLILPSVVLDGSATMLKTDPGELDLPQDGRTGDLGSIEMMTLFKSVE